MKRVTVSEAVAQFLGFAKETVSAITYAMYRRYLARFACQFGDRPLTSLTPAEVRRWGQRYHPVQAVQRLFAWCKSEQSLIVNNPLEGMRKMPRGRRIRIVCPAESTRLLRAATPEFRRLLFAFRESIARPGEIRAADWEDVRVAGLQPFTGDDLRQGRAFIFLDRFKARHVRDDAYAVRVIPISKRLGRLLARLWERSAGALKGPIFLNRRDQRWTVNAVICRLRRLRTAAGVSIDHRGENIVAYSMRHTGATRAICSGIDLATLAAVMGHSDVRMTSRYVHLAPDHLAKAMGRMSELKNRFTPKSERLGLRRTRPDA